MLRKVTNNSDGNGGDSGLGLLGAARIFISELGCIEIKSERRMKERRGSDKLIVT